MRKLAILFTFSFVLAIAAQEKFAPLAPELTNAKTVYIENNSRYAEIGDKAYGELRKWKRFAVVGEPDKADLVFVFDYRALDSGAAGAVVGGMAVAIPVRRCEVTLTIKNSEKLLWTNTKPCGGRGAATELIRDLRRRYPR